MHESMREQLINTGHVLFQHARIFPIVLRACISPQSCALAFERLARLVGAPIPSW